MISHLALIMDGNRRWAKQQGLFSWQGHRQGSKTVEMAIAYCIEKGISYLSLYAFSIENLQRSEEEKSYLFKLIIESNSRSYEFIKNGVKVRFVGDLSLLPKDVEASCYKLMKETSLGEKLVCNFLVCYGGQQEIIAAIQKIIDSEIKTVDKDILKSHLWLGNIPDPEIIIRTGGVERLSNFLLFQSAYSEIRFLDCFWPALTKDLLDKTMQDCLLSKKNFGK
ncbi:di-trans,poly-cis-decaprenylcistransferase [Candidatus Dependentiae bacterium]|nr:di-trans,poly-cis-decaprenylcistransferase [Candidatus Dependentiae bacterium]